MDFANLQTRLAADRGAWAKIARATGLHVNSIRKIANGETPSPRISTVYSIAAYYADADKAQRRRRAA